MAPSRPALSEAGPTLRARWKSQSCRSSVPNTCHHRDCCTQVSGSVKWRQPAQTTYNTCLSTPLSFSPAPGSVCRVLDGEACVGSVVDVDSFEGVPYMISSSLSFPGELWSVSFLARPFLHAPTPGAYKTFLIFSMTALPTGHGEGGLAYGGSNLLVRLREVRRGCGGLELVPSKKAEQSILMRGRSMSSEAQSRHGRRSRLRILHECGV